LGSWNVTEKKNIYIYEGGYCTSQKEKFPCLGTVGLQLTSVNYSPYCSSGHTGDVMAFGTSQMKLSQAGTGRYIELLLVPLFPPLWHYDPERSRGEGMLQSGY
jgi:hypothetical protein